ncbi:contactin-associated protein-like 2 isoform X2 [Ischnura elegans]|uniref:contactin-associated protein-like 2 isoform X2 n=1 Tax=Ischnura elegans TaxID=197161 RepID=UPI001ED8AD1C|nr:contactin-associated protein-like 2 isoform X2 [Ischnura elegans]
MHEVNEKLLIVASICINLLSLWHSSKAETGSNDVRCELVPDGGPCRGFTHMWYYNKNLGKCETFIYGGCKGNDNRFTSEYECLFHCGGGGHTLPPYLRPATQPTPVEGDARVKGRPNITRKVFDYEWWSWDDDWSHLPPIPTQERGQQLTFAESGYHQIFTFAQKNAFVQLDASQIPSFQLRFSREISFQFRTRLPHGLLVYHSVKDRPKDMEPYALYVIVEKGELKVVHVFGKYSTTVNVGQGLNHDSWHKVVVLIDIARAKLIARVDDMNSTETSILGLSLTTGYSIPTDLSSVVLIGGLSPEERLHGVKYIIESFVGCIKDVVLKSGTATNKLSAIKPLIATKHENVREGCVNKCRTRENLCFVGSLCINHYNALTCDCFGTFYEGERCDIYTSTMLTLRGSSYVSYRIYDWKDRVHSSANRISLWFKTSFDDSALFYASGESLKHQHVAASIKNSSVYVEIDFGGSGKGNESSLQSVLLGEDLTSNHWHNLTISHVGSTIRVSLDNEVKELKIPGPHHHLYIDPEIYIGGGPELRDKIGLASRNNFVGALKYVFFNDISILYELEKGNPKVHYIGVLAPEFHGDGVDVIPLTLPFSSSHIWWPSTEPNRLEMTFDFKSSRSMAVLASSEVTTVAGKGYWELRLVNEEIRFELIPDSNKNVTHLTTVRFDSRGPWHSVDFSYKDGELKLTVDYKHKQTQFFGLKFDLGEKVLIGSSEKTKIGLIGCMREIEVNGIRLEPRSVVRSRHTVGEVSLDNCQLVDPCKRPNACKHGGKCSVKDDKVTCDCRGTGYIGKNCHFAEYRKTCEELALLGYTKPDVYLIDIDGNGRFPPAHVKCEFQSLEDSTKTIVEHNLPSQVDVRSSGWDDFSFSISYREFTSEMLQELIAHSLHCSQYIKYDCYKAPLELHSSTWFVSSSASSRSGHIIDYIGESPRGLCPCGVNKTCVNPEMSCHCDISEGKWNSDEGYFTSPSSLGITEMVFLQQPDLDQEAQGRITLGPLECVEANTQKYVVTFTTSQSYIEVPGWRKGDIAFSFRTTGEKAILLYQPPIRLHHPSFMVALTSDFRLTFNFTLNGKSRELEIISHRKLNNGEWQKIWIDYNEHHVRFMINTDYQMVDLLPEEEFGPFEGSMFVGGAPEELQKKTSVAQGLIGCFRGLVVNGEILDIYSYMSVHLSEIIKDCKPSCDPNPCKNGAHCKELWSTFKCECLNRWAHIGTFCETNINTKGLTFLKPSAFLRKNYLSDISTEDKSILKSMFSENILLNLRTYNLDSLILYANDHMNNFIQLHIDDGIYIVFTFNYGNEIQSISVENPVVNTGKSVQIAIERKPTETVLHVNDRNGSVAKPVELLTEYSSKPWINPDKEMLYPPRPPSPPQEYFQINLGGYNVDRFKTMPGFVGCIRGLRIGENLVDLPAMIANTQKTDFSGVISGCRMKCDAEPCKNQGICIENFQRGESTCNCEHTSYYGEFCSEEKGADFGGESVLQRKFQLEGPVNHVKVQLAFSSNELRHMNTVLLLLQTENKRSYYLLVALTSEGHLIFEEDREGDGPAFGATITDRNFLNGARHSIFYQRTNENGVLLIDREPVLLSPLPETTFPNMPGIGANELQVGGLVTNDSRFEKYEDYNGCLSNLIVEVNSDLMKPLEEYMLFTKAGSEKVAVLNPMGVRSAQCALFDLVVKPKTGGPYFNKSVTQDTTWVEDPPARIPYLVYQMGDSSQEEGGETVIFIVLASIFGLIVFFCLIELYRTHRQFKKRQEMEEDAKMLWHKGQPVLYADPIISPSPVKMIGYQSVPQEIKPKIPVSTNGSDRRQLAKSGIDQASSSPSKIRFEIPEETRNEVEKQVSFKGSSDDEIVWKPVEEEDTEPLNNKAGETTDRQINAAERRGSKHDNEDDIKHQVHAHNVKLTSLPYSIDELGSMEFTTTPYA